MTPINEYLYDTNGNMIRDDNKGITNIIYNHLNLPEVITLSGGTITFLYDANGTKLRKTVSNGTQQDYLGGIEYKNGAIEAIYHEEGWATPSGTMWQYEYYLKDHLGNTRVIFADSNNDGTPEIIQEADYYPFGMRHQNATATNHYLYNGKELNTDLGLDWYDYGARWLDVETGRWSSIDPMAESYASMSPFNYVANNPISNIDPDGRRIIMSNAIEANNLVADLNRVYEDKYGFKNAFKATTKVFNIKKKNENYSYWWSWSSDEPEFITVKEPRTIIETNNQFDWNTDIYTKAMFDVVNTKADITVDIIADKGVLARQTAGRAGFRNGLLDDLGGGHAVHSGYVVLSDLLSNTQVGGNNTHKWTLGHVALHELLYHVHPLGNYDEDTVDGANTMRIYYGGRSGGSHNSGNKKNKMLLDVNEKQRLEKLRNSTGKKSKP